MTSTNPSIINRYITLYLEKSESKNLNILFFNKLLKIIYYFHLWLAPYKPTQISCCLPSLVNIYSSSLRPSLLANSNLGKYLTAINSFLLVQTVIHPAMENQFSPSSTWHVHPISFYILLS